MLDKLFWTPGAVWRIENNSLIIEEFAYSEKLAALFPNMYFMTQTGIFEEDIYLHFENVNVRLLKRFIEDLKKKNILVNHINLPGEIFYHQANLSENEYNEELIINQSALDSFKKDNNERDYSRADNQICLDTEYQIPHVILDRRSCRNFDKSIISFEEFKRLFSVYKQKQESDTVRYFYASAGGLYLIDIYVYVKENRVENLKEGIYYFNPKCNTISLVKECKITKECQYYTNQDIFDSSAFSIYYFYNANVSIPKYGGLGYYYAILDLGIMIELFTVNAEKNGFGLCSIGEMKFDQIQDYFPIMKNQVYLHTVEAGKKH